VVVISASFGAGHDGAARELVREFATAGYQVTCHDFLDLVWGPLGRTLRRTYENQLKVAPGSWGWLLNNLSRHGWINAGVSGLSARAGLSRMRAVIGPDPAAVVSTHPLASQVLGLLRRRGELAAPAFTFLTDMSVHPIWVAEDIDLHLALHEVAAAQARAHGAARVEVIRPAVDPAFARPAAPGERLAVRRRYGLPVDEPVALIVAGSWGVGEVEHTAAEVTATGLATAVTLCGRNEELRRRITDVGSGVALGWVTEMPALIRAADVVVQNAGGLTSLESMAAGVPVLTYRCLPGHGTTNAAALDRAGLARWITDPAGLAPALYRALRYGPAPAASQLFSGLTAADTVCAFLPASQRPVPASGWELPPVPPAEEIAPLVRIAR
jgi:UDP-N-acetylglucosamine:LPS N-acetylglucosamine transferase